MTMITVVKPTFSILSSLEGLPELIERAGRVCYKSEDRLTPTSAAQFVRTVRRNGHLSVLEHASISVLILGDRSMSHQLVRHRIGAFSQESQRFCNYGRKGFQVICPPSIGVPEGEYSLDTFGNLNLKNIGTLFSLSLAQRRWLQHRCEDCLEYINLLNEGILPEDARSCLPNATKTEIVATFNLRQWRHVFAERALNRHAQWQIKDITRGILREFAGRLPCVFEDQLETLNATN